MRSMVWLLSEFVHGKSLSIADMPVRMDVRGIGLSDWEGYAQPLTNKLSYVNTFYTRQPALDITAPPAELCGQMDFVMSSDVFEHVQPPVAAAFAGAAQLLKPGGALLLSVPYTTAVATTEHFPNLYKFEIMEQDGEKILVNQRRDGSVERFSDLRFHGGEGHTLEMREFCRDHLITLCHGSGLGKIMILSECLAHGIRWDDEDSLPIIAWKST